jgi:dienelactone hydrolase
METCCFICDRSALRFVVVIVLVIVAIAPVRAMGAIGPIGPIAAQQTTAPTQKKATPTAEPQAQEPVPPDHYDPDDVKTYADVRTEDKAVTVQGRPFAIHFYRPIKPGAAIPAIYACGDGGWRGLAPRTAQQLAHMGFAVAGIDSKVYLREYSTFSAPLTIKQLATDYVDIAKDLRAYAEVQPTTPVYVYGWSLGAGFAIAVGADEATRVNWAGIISIGLPKQNQLVSGLGANHANLKAEENSRFGFRTQDLMSLVTPLPLVMIQSTTDTASPPKVGQALYGAAKDPKHIVLIKASNHRFSGARDEFYAALGDAVSWMRDPASGFKATETSMQRHAIDR